MMLVLMLCLDLTFREFHKHHFKYGFTLEKTGLETRPTFSFCDVRIHYALILVTSGDRNHLDRLDHGFAALAPGSH